MGHGAERLRREGYQLGPANTLHRSRYRGASGPRPDRVAGWAVALGIFLVLVAGATAHAATGIA